jgi:hypothetical protein
VLAETAPAVPLCADDTEVVMLVAFLEDRYIRMLPIDARMPLRTPGESWQLTLRDYLWQTGCPLLSELHPYTGETYVTMFSGWCRMQ